MKNLSLFILLLLFVFPAYADQTATITWDAPTTRVDGTPIAPTEIKNYTIYREIDAPVTTGSFSFDVAPGTTANDTLSLAPQAAAYTVNYFMTVTLTDGTTSAPSSVASKTFVVKSTSNPQPSVIKTITITCDTSCTITTQ